MPVLEKNTEHESNRDLEREKDRDREGKDREKGPKSKGSTKSMAQRLALYLSTYAASATQPKIYPTSLASSSR
jgi:hypothetical protein